MSLLTESEAKKIIAEKALTGGVYHIPPGQILTPSARAAFTEKNITVKASGMAIIQNGEKPEHMTHLYGDVLVEKDHPRIAMRGMIDYLESEIICVQLKHTHIRDELQEIINFLRKIMRCEVSGTPLDETTLQGMTPQELREHSHHTTKYYGISHFLPSDTFGSCIADLNRLRTITRQTELAAYRALKNENRNDIIQALNRLSSLIWIMMVKERKGG